MVLYFGGLISDTHRSQELLLEVSIRARILYHVPILGHNWVKAVLNRSFLTFLVPKLFSTRMYVCGLALLRFVHICGKIVSKGGEGRACPILTSKRQETD